MRINDKFSVYDGKKSTEEFENQMVDLRTPSYWDKFKEWQKPYQALFLSVLTLIVVGIVIGLCLHFVGSEGKEVFFYSFLIMWSQLKTFELTGTALEWRNITRHN